MHWARLNEVSFVWGMKFLFYLYSFFGRTVFRIFLYPVIFFYVVFHKSARNSSIAYLKKIDAFNGSNSPNFIFFRVVQHFFEFGEVILDKFIIWSGRADDLTWRTDGFDEYENLMRGDRGILTIVSHVGNSDLCQKISDLYLASPLTVLVHTLHAKKFNTLLKRFGASKGVNFYQVSEFGPATAIALSEKIQRGENIAMAADRVPLSEGGRITVSFLGADAEFPVGPYVLAASLKCPLIFLAATKINGTYVLKAKLIAMKVDINRENRSLVIKELAQKYAKFLEDECISSPYQWFNFYPFWVQECNK